MTQKSEPSKIEKQSITFFILCFKHQFIVVLGFLVLGRSWILQMNLFSKTLRNKATLSVLWVQHLGVSFLCNKISSFPVRRVPYQLCVLCHCISPGPKLLPFCYTPISGKREVIEQGCGKTGIEPVSWNPCPWVCHIRWPHNSCDCLMGLFIGLL